MTSVAVQPSVPTSPLSVLWGRLSGTEKSAEATKQPQKHQPMWTMLIADVPAYRLSGYPIEEIESLCRDSQATLRLMLIALQARDRVGPEIEGGLMAAWQTARSCVNLSGKVGDHQGARTFAIAHESLEGVIESSDVLETKVAIQSALELMEVALVRAFGEAALREEAS